MGGAGERKQMNTAPTAVSSAIGAVMRAKGRGEILLLFYVSADGESDDAVATWPKALSL